MVLRCRYDTDNHPVQNATSQLGRQLRLLRGKYDLTQDELAARAGLSSKYLQNLEGKRPKNASIMTLQKIADAFGIPLWKLLKFE